MVLLSDDDVVIGGVVDFGGIETHIMVCSSRDFYWP